jgi:hypothetical protein
MANSVLPSITTSVVCGCRVDRYTILAAATADPDMALVANNRDPNEGEAAAIRLPGSVLGEDQQSP